MDKNKYLFRKQFAIGPAFLDQFAHWQRIAMGDLCITAHPDLELTKATRGDDYLYLLGYILDPHNAANTNLDIITEILTKAKSADDIFTLLADKCGRYVIIAKLDAESRIFSDATGMRQVFYHRDAEGKLWCASQPHIIAEHLGIMADVAVALDLQKTTLFSSESNYWYPGSVTLYPEIHHLIPNHYLDLHQKITVRYWPRQRLKPISVDEAVETSSGLLRGIIRSAGHRFSNLAFAISSGLDSRLLLAASKDNGKKIKYFTHIHRNSTDPHAWIPSRLCEQLGLPHTAIEFPAKVAEEFEGIFKRNVLTARKSTMQNAYAIYNHFEADKNNLTVLYGNCAEITKRDRCRYPQVPEFLITAKSITEMALLSKSKTALHEFEKWLVPVKKLAGTCNVSILDLLHWEHRVGSWASMSFHEYETAFEVVCPYSCRLYIETLLSVPFKYRTKPNYVLQHKIAERLWPETLSVPINPQTGFKGSIENLLYRTYLYDPLKYLLMMYYRRFK